MCEHPVAAEGLELTVLGSGNDVNCADELLVCNGCSPVQLPAWRGLSFDLVACIAPRATKAGQRGNKQAPFGLAPESQCSLGSTPDSIVNKPQTKHEESAKAPGACWLKAS